MRSLCRAWYKAINGRIKLFRVTSTKFRHNLDEHQTCFHAILVMTQVHIMVSDTNFRVYYNEDVDLFV
jgi:hypothetical protein